MAGPYARGHKAFGFCDRCGFRCKLDRMRKLVVKGQLIDIKVCEECYELDQPQLHVGEQPMWDPQALQFARPDNTIPGTRGLCGWNPVASQTIQTTVNSVTITGG